MSLYDDLEKLVTALYPEPELRARAPRAATYLFRLVGDCEPVGRLVAEVVRQSAPTLPPPAADLSPIPATLPTGPGGTPGRNPKGTP